MARASTLRAQGEMRARQERTRSFARTAVSSWLPSDSSELELLDEAPLSDGRFFGCASTLTQPRSSAALSSSRDIGERVGATRIASEEVLH